MAAPLTQDQLNAIAKGSGYTGTFSNTGLATTPQVSNASLGLAPTTLNSTNTQPNQSITIPPVVKTDPTPMVNNGNALVASGNAQVTANQESAAKLGITIPGVGSGDVSASRPETKTDTTSTDKGFLGSTADYIKSLIGSYGALPSEAEQYAKTYGITPEEAQTRLTQAEADTNAKNATYNTAKAKLAGLNAQLASMNLQTTANNTSLETEGGAITSRGVGVAQAQNSRDNLIAQAPVQFQALMAQADVATAQGDVQLAQSIQQQAQGHLDDLFKAQLQDSQNAYSQRKDLIDKAYAYADKQQQQQLDAQKQTLATNNTQYNNFLNDLRTDGTSATSNGQGSLATQLYQLGANLDPNSKTFAQDYQTAQAKYATLKGQIQAKATPEEKNQGTINNINTQLTGAKGSDGYTDPNLYARLRSSSTLSATDFDNRFAYLVNPASRAKLGLTSAQAGNTTITGNFTPTQTQSLIGAGIPANQLDTIATYVGQYGLDAALKNSDMTPAQKTALKAIYGQ